MNVVQQIDPSLPHPAHSKTWLAGVALIGWLGVGCSADESGGQDSATTVVVGFGGQGGTSVPAGAAGTSTVTGPGAAGPGVAGRAATAPTAGIGAAGSRASGPGTMSPIGGGMAGAPGAPPVGPVGGAPMAPGAAMPPAGAGQPMAVADCPAPPAGTADKAVQALNAVNQLRVGAGGTCMNSVPTLVQSAQAHCDYQQTNKGNAMCMADAHSEVMGCTGFTGRDVQSREVAAGYPRALAYTEVANTIGNNPMAAVINWVDTVYHRIPLLDPWTVDMGYGGGPGCDVIDIGRGMSAAAADTIVVFPYDGQTNVAPTWNGLEGPAPPAPAGGWPSSYIINIYAKGIAVTEHVLTKDGDPTPLEHTWLDKQNPGVASLANYFPNVAFMYGAPFQPNTKYRVKIAGTYSAGALNVEWTFTTGMKRAFGF